jgi:hypothetical protein
MPNITAEIIFYKNTCALIAWELDLTGQVPPVKLKSQYTDWSKVSFIPSERMDEQGNRVVDISFFINDKHFFSTNSLQGIIQLLNLDGNSSYIEISDFIDNPMSIMNALSKVIQ